jgi:hypothetical protein
LQAVGSLRAELLAIDASKFKAVNNKHKNFTPAKLETAIEVIDEKVERSTGQRGASEKGRELKERQKRSRRCVEEITASGKPQLSRTHPDSRARPKSPQVDGGDHVQLAVDSQHTLVVEQNVTKANTADDRLSPMARRAKATLRVERIRAVADTGSAHGHELKACEEVGMAADVPQPSTSANPSLDSLARRASPMPRNRTAPDVLRARSGPFDVILPSGATLSATLPPVQAGAVP